jgi:hypothetical protein
MKKTIAVFTLILLGYSTFAHAEAETTLCGVKMPVQNMAYATEGAPVDQVINGFRSEGCVVKVCLIDKGFAVVATSGSWPAHALIWSLNR